MATSRITLGKQLAKRFENQSKSGVTATAFSPWFEELKQREPVQWEVHPRFDEFKSLAWFVGLSDL